MTINYPDIDYDLDHAPNFLKGETQKQIDTHIALIQKFRNEVIVGCVDIDSIIGNAISRFFFGDNRDKKPIFHTLVLDTTILSMSQKKNILKSIMEKYPEEFGEFSDVDKRKKLFQDLDQIIKLRNALAHGRIVIDCASDIVTLNYYDSNKNKQTEMELPTAYFDSMNKKISFLLVKIK